MFSKTNQQQNAMLIDLAYRAGQGPMEMDVQLSENQENKVKTKN
jgi:hypothetical protein